MQLAHPWKSGLVIGCGTHRAVVPEGQPVDTVAGPLAARPTERQPAGRRDPAGT